MPVLSFAQVLSGANGNGSKGSFSPSIMKERSVQNLKENWILRSVCCALEQLVFKSEQPRGHHSDLLAFSENIFQSGLCTKECFVIALLYGQRLQQKFPSSSVLNSQNVHRMFLVCLMTASKFLDDFYCRNVYFAVAGGLSNEDLSDLELRLCFLLDFDLSVSLEQYNAAITKLSVESSFKSSPSVWVLPPQKKMQFFMDSSSPCIVPRPLDAPFAPSSLQPAWRAREAYHAPASSETTTSLPWDPREIWRPLPRGIPRACLADPLGAAGAWCLRDPLGAAGAWFARPYCPTA